MYKTIISFRNSGVSIAVSGPGMERKLNRTRKMSENIQTVASKTLTTIPTQKEDITIKWIHMIINQNLLKSGKAPLDQEAIEGMNFEIIDCKSRYAILYSIGVQTKFPNFLYSKNFILIFGHLFPNKKFVI